jgi:hypothetical protein
LPRTTSPTVWQQDHDDLLLGVGLLGQLVGELDRGEGGHAGGASDQQRLLPREPAGHRERVGVGDLDDPVGDRGVVGGGPEVLPDALDEVGAAGATGVDRALRVGAHDLDRAAALLLEVATHAADSAAGAHAADEVGDLPFRLLPDLRAGGLVVGARVVRVGVLVGLPGALDLTHQAVGDAVVGVGVLGVDRRRAHDHFGAVRLQHVALVLGDLVRADEDALVALGLRHHRQADTGVARRRLDDRAARLQRPVRLGGFDHPQRDPVLHRAARVEVLHLGEHQRRGAVGGLGEAQQGGVADEVQE